jgi:membrane-bound lytic murein transglycosylase D
MKRLMMRMWLLSAIAMGLSACGGGQTVVIREEPLAYAPSPAPLAAPALPRKPYKQAAAYSGFFLKPGELEPAVEFWRNVYVKWRRSEVVFHDDRHLDVIYEVMTLPGYVDESLTPEQKDIVSRRRNFWKTQLAVLEGKLRYNAPLNAGERELLARLESGGRPLASILNGAADRVHAQRGTRERFKRGLEISARYERQFRKIFRNAGLPEDLAYLPHVESSFQPAARSSAGAVGMWQFTKAAAKRFMPGNHRTDRRLDPYASAAGAANYLGYAYSMLGNWPAAITSYNHGINGMKRAQNQFGPDFARIVQNYASPAFGFASRNYYAQFLAAREIASDPAQYFPEEGMYAERNGLRKVNVSEAALLPLNSTAAER